MPWVDDGNVVLLTDLYELTMAATYHAEAADDVATFDLFVRRLPAERRFLVAAGLEDALDYLEGFRFGAAALEYLGSLGRFSSDFLERLASLRFTGDVWAIPEGVAAFAEEPLLRVSAPIVEAQLVETFLLNCVGFQTMVASKAARVSIACDGRPFVDFSARRDHGADAALKAARVAWIAGAAGTSNVLAGQVYGIPLSGTMAHSYVMRFEREIDAFRAYARAFPGDAVLLIDTYDTEEAARTVVDLARELAADGVGIAAVRLDSGDLADLSTSVRKILDAGGGGGIRIFASGDLDEYRIAELLAHGAPIDAFGVGTQLGTSGDAPSLGVVYKLVDAGGPRMKLATGKVTLPGRKQVWRFLAGGHLDHDMIALEGEDVGGEPLLEHVMTAGRRTVRSPGLEEIRERTARTVSILPEALRRLERAGAGAGDYPVERSPALQDLVERLTGEHDG